MIYLSPAKINLGLKVVGKRPDGYHLLKTIFCLINLYDHIDIQVPEHYKKDHSLHCDDMPTTLESIALIDHTQPWAVENDLAYRAALLLKKFTGTTMGANIRVTKNIPTQAGLGGGSSNAATVLLALNHLWQTKLSQQQLVELGRKLGADVPFFIYAQNAFATGIGDQFTPITIPEQYIVLIQPGFTLSTKEVFNYLDLSLIKASNRHAELVSASIYDLLDTKENDLYPAAAIIQPSLATIIQDLAQYGQPAMTGTGSTLYLTFPTEEAAKKVATSLETRYNSLLVKTLQISPLFQLSY